ncbi:hypothetical protein [Limnobacter sp.]|uniref:hypothetical protein n=1 Tax=Limnobacter sp. TaxID=2003368 RepID=UPI0035154567
MASDLEKQLEQVRTVRNLRVQARLREQQAKDKEVKAAQHELARAEHAVLEQERKAITLQRDGLQQLVNDSVTVMDLLKFNKRKVRSIKHIKDAKVTVFERTREAMLALEQLKERVKATKEAEKKLMGIDEVIAGKLWK